MYQVSEALMKGRSSIRGSEIFVANDSLLKHISIAGLP
jgi:hypothetical protein